MSETWFRMIRESQEYIEKISNQLIQDKKSQHMQVPEGMIDNNYTKFNNSFLPLKLLLFSKKIHNAQIMK